MKRTALLRRGSPMRRNTKMKAHGKRWKEWEDARRLVIKPAFERAGITRCENCGTTYALSFAHSHARRNIPPGSPLIYEVALLCFMTSDYRTEQSCHAEADSKGEAHRTEFIKRIISARETAVILPGENL